MLISPEEALKVILELTRVLEDLEVPYAVGGSLASSMHGIPRSTRDGDLLADLRGEHAQPFVAAIETRFYVSQERVFQAVQRRSSFNLVHLKTAMQKLRWYQIGDRVSDQQWNDVLGVLKVQGDRLDFQYLRKV